MFGNDTTDFTRNTLYVASLIKLSRIRKTAGNEHAAASKPELDSAQDFIHLFIFVDLNALNAVPLKVLDPQRMSVGGRLKTGQWWSIQNQPLIWLVKRVRVVLARRVFVLSWIVFAGD